MTHLNDIWIKIQSKYNQNTIVSFRKNVFESVACETVVTYSVMASGKWTRLYQRNQRVADLPISPEQSLLAATQFGYCAFTIVICEHTRYFENFSNFFCGLLSYNHTNFIAYTAQILRHWGWEKWTVLMYLSDDIPFAFSSITATVYHFACWV